MTSRVSDFSLSVVDPSIVVQEGLTPEIILEEFGKNNLETINPLKALTMMTNAAQEYNKFWENLKQSDLISRLPKERIQALRKLSELFWTFLEQTFDHYQHQFSIIDDIVDIIEQAKMNNDAQAYVLDIVEEQKLAVQEEKLGVNEEKFGVNEEKFGVEESKHLESISNLIERMSSSRLSIDTFVEKLSDGDMDKIDVQELCEKYKSYSLSNSKVLIKIWELIAQQCSKENEEWIKLIIPKASKKVWYIFCGILTIAGLACACVFIPPVGVAVTTIGISVGMCKGVAIGAGLGCLGMATGCGLYPTRLENEENIKNIIFKAGGNYTDQLKKYASVFASQIKKFDFQFKKLQSKAKRKEYDQLESTFKTLQQYFDLYCLEVRKCQKFILQIK